MHGSSVLTNETPYLIHVRTPLTSMSNISINVLFTLISSIYFALRNIFLHVDPFSAAPTGFNRFKPQIHCRLLLFPMLRHPRLIKKMRVNEKLLEI